MTYTGILSRGWDGETTAERITMTGLLNTTQHTYVLHSMIWIQENASLPIILLASGEQKKELPAHLREDRQLRKGWVCELCIFHRYVPEE